MGGNREEAVQAEGAASAKALGQEKSSVVRPRGRARAQLSQGDLREGSSQYHTPTALLLGLSR
jgi:hypothetical protein